jgi:hypothetical protein
MGPRHANSFNKAKSQKALSDLGRKLLHLQDKDQPLRSERNDVYQSRDESCHDNDPQQAFFSKKHNSLENDTSSPSEQWSALHPFRPSCMAECNATRDSAGGVRVVIALTSEFILGSTKDFNGSKKMVFEICRLPSSDFPTKISTMGIYLIDEVGCLESINCEVSCEI